VGFRLFSPRVSRATAPVDHDQWGAHWDNRLWGHFIIALSIFDAYFFRQRLVPELVATMAALQHQALQLGAAAAASASIGGIGFLFSKRNSRARSFAYITGAVLFGLLTFAMLVNDYHRHAEPGTFSQRVSEAYQRFETMVGDLFGR